MIFQHKAKHSPTFSSVGKSSSVSNPATHNIFWIGLHDEVNEGLFEWESGQQLTSEIYHHFGYGEPDNHQNED